MPTDKGTSRARLLIALLAGIAFSLVLYWVIQLPSPNRNTLAIGKSADGSAVSIEINPPVELDSKSKEQVLNLRREAVYRHRDLIVGEYKPSNEVFGQIKDGLPWWGIQGQFFYGKGEKSIEGVSEESRFVVNPFLLVAAEFDGLSMWAFDDGLWDRKRVTDADLNRTDFPFYCPPSRLQWQPRQARTEVTYNVSGCLAEMNRWVLSPLGVRNATLSLIAYNARDMNLNYLFLSVKDSTNLSQAHSATHPIAIPQFIHPGGSCGYPGGCNNMSPYSAELSEIAITRLPAQASIRLWSEQPADSEQSPDMTFVIHFE